MEFEPRDLEWQRRYTEQDTPWDKGTAAPPLVAYLRENRIVGKILVPGCGRGHDVRLLAAQPEASVVGLDLSPSAVEQARNLSSAWPNAEFVTGDFFLPSPERIDAFDWIVEHTCFCAIEPQQRADYVRGATKALRPGGKIFAIFYVNPSSETAPPFRVSKEELSTLFDPGFLLLEEWVPKESFPGREERELIRVMQKR